MYFHFRYCFVYVIFYNDKKKKKKKKIKSVVTYGELIKWMAQDLSAIDPGPTDCSVLTGQDTHHSTGVERQNMIILSSSNNIQG